MYRPAALTERRIEIELGRLNAVTLAETARTATRATPRTVTPVPQDHVDAH